MGSQIGVFLLRRPYLVARATSGGVERVSPSGTTIFIPRVVRRSSSSPMAFLTQRILLPLYQSVPPIGRPYQWVFGDTGDLYVMSGFWVARWRGSWEVLGGQFNNYVTGLIDTGDQMFVAGFFTESQSGATTFNRVARWDGTAWQPMDAGVETTLAPVLAAYNGQPVIGGTFVRTAHESNPVTLNRIARWNGTAWEPMANGFSDGRVYSLIVHDGQLIAGGTFSRTPDPHPDVAGIARWGGTAWQQMGDGVVACRSLYSSAGTLYAGARIPTPENSIGRCVSYWTGSAWQQMGGFFNGDVEGFWEYEDSLHVFGGFSEVAGVSASRHARWDGTAWGPVPESYGQSGGRYRPFIVRPLQDFDL